MLLNDKIRITPFARILPPLAAGIACQRFASAPLWAVALIAAAIYAGAWLTRKIPAGRAYVYASLFCTGLLLADLSSTKRPMPRNERLAMIVEIDRSMVCALVAGERRTMDRDLRAAYARTGTAHILAVSGLHMGFVMLLVNLALGWIVLLRHGHLIRNVLAILALWTYAVMAGLSPSVVRSALMLSAAQAALGASVSGNGYNVVLGTATLMLAVRPGYLSDVSFQLSFAAVLSILFFYPRLYRRRLSRHRALDALYSSLLLGAAAQIGTLPLIAYHFGNVPLVSLAINPVVIFAAFVVIGASLLWLLCPLPLWNPFLSRIVETALTVQNGMVAHAAASPAAAIEGIVLPEWAVVLAYALLGMLAVAVKLREEKRTDGPTRRIRKRKVAH